MNYGSNLEQLKTMEMSEAQSDIYNKEYIYQLQPVPYSQNSLVAADAPSLKISSYKTSLR